MSPLLQLTNRRSQSSMSSPTSGQLLLGIFVLVLFVLILFFKLGRKNWPASVNTHEVREELGPWFYMRNPEVKKSGKSYDLPSQLGSLINSAVSMKSTCHSYPMARQDQVIGPS